MKYKVLIGLSIIVFLLPGALKSQVYERNRQEIKAFKVYKETSLEVYNKYGNIHLFTWDKDSVKIKIDVQVKANKESKADKIFEYINFEFSNTKYYIIARTQFKQRGTFWSEVSDLANTLFSGNNKAQIDYFVYMPKGMQAKFENKFGNVYITDLSGDIDLKLSNGDFKANDLTGKFDLKLSFGNASINSVESGNLNISYGELELGNAKDLIVESKSSTLNIEKVNSLKVNSRRDKFYIDELGSISGETSFSYLTLKNFNSDLNMNTEYGEVNLSSIHPDFKMIELTSKYTDILMNMNQNTSFLVDIMHSEDTQVNYPEGYAGLTFETIDKKEDIYKTSGMIGNQSGNKGNVKILIKAGNVTFRESY